MENTTNTETVSSSNTEIATTILRQINAADFWARARWGVQTPLADGNTLRLNCTKKIRIMITLDASDTYTVEVGRLKGRFSYVKADEMSDVYAEDLVSSIDHLFSKAFGSL